MHLAFDFDDVLCDFGGRVILTVNKEYGTSLTLDDVTDWNLSILLDPIIGEDWWLWWEERDWLWANADAVDGAMGGLRTLHAAGHYIEIVTATPPWARAAKLEWLGKWKPTFDRLTFGPARPPMDKLAVTRAQLIVDDKPETCRQFADAGRYALLFTRPHNVGYIDEVRNFQGYDFQDAPLAGQVTRVFDWAGVIKAIGLVTEVEAADAHRA